MPGQIQTFNFLDLKSQPATLLTEKMPRPKNANTTGSMTVSGARDSRINCLGRPKGKHIINYL